MALIGVGCPDVGPGGGSVRSSRSVKIFAAGKRKVTAPFSSSGGEFLYSIKKRRECAAGDSCDCCGLKRALAPAVDSVAVEAEVLGFDGVGGLRRRNITAPGATVAWVLLLLLDPACTPLGRACLLLFQFPQGSYVQAPLVDFSEHVAPRRSVEGLPACCRAKPLGGAAGRPPCIRRVAPDAGRVRRWLDRGLVCVHARG